MHSYSYSQVKISIQIKCTTNQQSSVVCISSQHARQDADRVDYQTTESTGRRRLHRQTQNRLLTMLYWQQTTRVTSKRAQATSRVLLTLLASVMIRNVFRVSINTIPCSPTAVGDVDRTTAHKTLICARLHIHFATFHQRTMKISSY
jgi:hypothetical protein